MASASDGQGHAREDKAYSCPLVPPVIGVRTWFTLPNILAVGAVLIAIGSWNEQTRSAGDAIAEVKLAVARNDQYNADTYQRKDVAAEQYARLTEQLIRIERQLTDLQQRRR